MFFVPVPPVVVPEAVIKERVLYYEVAGSHEPDLVREMNEKGPIGTDGSSWGATLPEMVWGYDVKSVGTTCVLVHPYVKVAIITILPKWTPPPGTTKTVISKWGSMISALTRHEAEHAQIDRDTANALASLMRRHPSDRTCQRLDDYLQSHGSAIDKHDELNAELDSRTGHGSKEGVAIQW